MNHTNFTSETLRLEPIDSSCSNSKGSDRTNIHVQTAVLNASQGFQKKKVSSFQITSIRPTSRSSNDGADDSENDTEDTSDILDSSRVTLDIDQETPSFSEDYSKSDDIIQVAGPVIPTSSNYGITALVQQTGTGGMMTARLPQGVTVNVTEGGLALAKADGEPDDLDNWQKRFKIVKIDSNKPFKRGRWVCLDFMDSPAHTAAGGKGDEVPNLVVSNIVSDKETPDYLQIPLAVSSVILPSQTLHSVSGQVPVQAPSTIAQMEGAAAQFTNSAGQPLQAAVVIPGYTGSQPTQGAVIPPPSGQTSSQTSAVSQSAISGTGNIHSTPEVPSSGISSTSSSISHGTIGLQSGIIHQTMSQSQFQPSVSQQSDQTQAVNLAQVNISTINVSHGMQPPVAGSGTQSQSSIQTNAPVGAAQPQTSHQVAAQHISQTVANSGQPLSQSISAQSMSQTIPAQQMGQNIPSQQVGQNIPPQQMSQNAPPQQMSQNISCQQISQNAPPSQPISQQIQSQQMPSSVQQPQLQSSGNQHISGSVSNVSAPSPAPIFTSLPSSAATASPVTTPAQAQSQISLGIGQQALPPESHTALQAQSGMPSVPTQPHPGTLEGLPLQGGETTGTTTATPPTAAEDAESFCGLLRALSNVSTTVSAEGQIPPYGPSMFTTSPIFTPPTQTPPLSGGPPVLDVPAEAAASLRAGGHARESSVDGRVKETMSPISASTASTVAIDNKIEQAMDLVKSHLMFAVREEVDVLKEKIVELMDRINHLECENTVLRQCASPEVLQQLPGQVPHQLQQPPHHSSTS